jgi:signal transduction histidine kinase
MKRTLAAMFRSKSKTIAKVGRRQRARTAAVGELRETETDTMPETRIIDRLAGTAGRPVQDLTRDELLVLLDHRNRQIEAIRRISDSLFSHPSVDAMVRATLQIALDVLRADAGTVFLHDASNDTLVFRYVIGGAGEQLIGKSIPASQGVAGTVFRTQRPVLIGDVQERRDFNNSVDKATGYETKSMMTVPVKRTDGDPIGVMQVLNARVPFTQQDLEVLEVLCAQAATGIEHARLAQEAKKAEIVHVIGDISHDIKNMLTPIMTGVWTLEPMLKRFFEELDTIRAKGTEADSWCEELGRAADAVRHDYGWLLGSAVNSAEQVQARTREIADAVKGELSPPLFEQIDFNEPCRAVVSTLKVVADKAGVTLNLDLDPNLPLVECDRKLIVNAIYNLVNNAIPFTPAGGSVTVRTRGPVEDGETFTVEVQDTGKGMPEHVRARILSGEPISTTVSGTGLGTRIVLGVIRRHNGTLDIQTSEGAGTNFIITLPLRHLDIGN